MPSGTAGRGLSKDAPLPASGPSPTLVAPISTDPKASKVPAVRPQARPSRIARPPATRSADASSIMEIGAPSWEAKPTRAPPTQAIRAVAEGPEPDFLRRRAVIVRHQGSPQGSGPGEQYRFLGASPDLSLLRRSGPRRTRPVHPFWPTQCFPATRRAPQPCLLDYVVTTVILTVCQA